jgi:hypothetical protein
VGTCTALQTLLRDGERSDEAKMERLGIDAAKRAAELPQVRLI